MGLYDRLHVVFPFYRNASFSRNFQIDLCDVCNSSYVSNGWNVLSWAWWNLFQQLSGVQYLYPKPDIWFRPELRLARQRPTWVPYSERTKYQWVIPRY